MIVGVHHIAVGVEDIDRALTFYTEGLGFEILKRGKFGESEYVDRAIGLKNARGKSAMLKGPNIYLELWQFVTPNQKTCDLAHATTAIRISPCRWTTFRRNTIGFRHTEWNLSARWFK